MQYTLKQIADKAGVSKTTVRRHRDKIPQSVLMAGSCNENGVLYYSEKIAEIILKSLENAGTQAEQTAKQAEQELDNLYRNVSEHVEKSTETERNVSKLSETQEDKEDRNAPELYRNGAELSEITYKAAIEALAEQLRTKDNQIMAKDEQIREKDEQIKAKDKQIERLEEMLNKAQNVLMEKKEAEPERLAAPEPDQEEPEHKKQSFFSWLFRKRS